MQFPNPHDLSRTSTLTYRVLVPRNAEERARFLAEHENRKSTPSDALHKLYTNLLVAGPQPQEYRGDDAISFPPFPARPPPPSMTGPFDPYLFIPLTYNPDYTDPRITGGSQHPAPGGKFRALE